MATEANAQVWRLAAKTGDDDDIDDLIIERARRKAERAKSGGGRGASETEDDLYVGRRPAASSPAPVASAATPAPAIARRNCGTHWTGWHPPAEARANPCPAGCEPGDRLQEKRHGTGASLVVDAQYQCHVVPASRDAALQARPVRDAQPPREAVGTLTPDSGRWNSVVEVKGPGFARAERVAVVWYPNDDDAQPPLGSSSATVGTRTGADVIQIEVPSGAGGAVGAVLRVLVFMPGQLQPLLAGRFTVRDGAGPAPLAQAAVRNEPVAKAVGPAGPELVAVTAVSMFSIKAEWKSVPGATSYVIKARESGQALPASSPEYLANAVVGGVSGLTPGFPHEVWVEARYPDRSVVASVIRQVATREPVNPSSAQATLAGPGTVTLSWTPVPGAVHYIVDGSQLTKPLQVHAASVTLRDVPMGRHEWRVMAAYKSGVYSDKSPAVAAIVLMQAGAVATGAAATAETNPVGAVGQAVGRAASSAGSVARDAAQATGKAVRDAGASVGAAVRSVVGGASSATPAPRGKP